MIDEPYLTPEDRHYLGELRQVEKELDDIASDLAISEALRSLKAMAGWTKLIERLGEKERSQVEKLRTVRLGEYDLGYLQGQLAALRQLTRDKPLSEEELAANEQRITVLRNRHGELKALLS